MHKGVRNEMFTGIIEEVGEVKAVTLGARSMKLKISAKKILSDIQVGDSIAVNGICLTVTSYTGKDFTADAMPETVRVTSFSKMKSGDWVNLERALTLNRRLGGHIVSGHVDGLGEITEMNRDDNAVFIQVKIPESLAKYIVSKGSITIDGISLTVVSCARTWFSVSVIPHTASETTLGLKKPGDMVNIENDMLGKYIERLLNFSQEETQSVKSGIDAAFLTQHGFK